MGIKKILNFTTDPGQADSTSAASTAVQTDSRRQTLAGTKAQWYAGTPVSPRGIRSCAWGGHCVVCVQQCKGGGGRIIEGSPYGPLGQGALSAAPFLGAGGMHACMIL